MIYCMGNSSGLNRVCSQQAGDVQSAVKSYERAVKLAGKDAPGVYKLMGELARRSAALPGVALDQLEGSLPSIDSLPSHKVDELEDAAAGAHTHPVLIQNIYCPAPTYASCMYATCE